MGLRIAFSFYAKSRGTAAVHVEGILRVEPFLQELGEFLGVHSFAESRIAAVNYQHYEVVVGGKGDGRARMSCPLVLLRILSVEVFPVGN